MTTVAQRPDDVFDDKYEIYRRRADVKLTIQRRDGLGVDSNERNILFMKQQQQRFIGHFYNESLWLFSIWNNKNR